jgi:hypothetical protein
VSVVFEQVKTVNPILEQKRHLLVSVVFEQDFPLSADNGVAADAVTPVNECSPQTVQYA